MGTEDDVQVAGKHLEIAHLPEADGLDEFQGLLLGPFAGDDSRPGLGLLAFQDTVGRLGEVLQILLAGFQEGVLQGRHQPESGGQEDHRQGRKDQQQNLA